MDLEYAAEKILQSREPGKMLLVEKIPQHDYHGLITVLKKNLKTEGPYISMDFSELVKRVNLDIDEKDFLSGYYLQHPTQNLNGLFPNAYLTNDVFPEFEIWSAYCTARDARMEAEIPLHSRFNGIFLAKPGETLCINDLTFKSSNPNSINTELQEAYDELGIRFVYPREDSFYTADCSMKTVDLGKSTGVKIEMEKILE